MTPSPALFAAGSTNSAGSGIVDVESRHDHIEVRIQGSLPQHFVTGMSQEFFSHPNRPDLAFLLYLEELGKDAGYCKRILTWRDRMQVKHVEPIRAQRVERPFHSFTQNRSGADRPEPPRHPGRCAVGQGRVCEQRIGTQMDFGGKDDILPTPCQPLSKQVVDAGSSPLHRRR